MATTNKKYTPIEAIHPSELIIDEIKARGMKRKELAERLGMKAPNLSRFFRNKENITPAMALKLEEALGIPANHWLGLQVSYERDVKAIQERNIEETKAIEIERFLSTIFNIPILYKKLSIDGYRFFRDKLDMMYKIFNVSNIEEMIALSTSNGRFKKSETLETEYLNLNTWILLARHACNEVSAGLKEYTKGNETKAAKEIASKANTQNIKEDDIKIILNKYGIGYCVVEKFEKTPVDAYSVIINEHPFIVVSHRRDNMDMLVFDVLHECGHINMHLKEGLAFVSFNQDSNNNDKVEREANNYAKNILIPAEVWAKIMRGKSTSLNVYSLIKAVTEEAKKNGISPTIAAWRFKYETRIYKIQGYKSQPI